jgi:superfamily I DNA/RNA helicase
MRRVPPAAWRPVGVSALEDVADLVVRSNGSALVIAGPGAGKTELLAQRACYLLQTGTCPRPKRILAISFKRDAARNLHERILERCGREDSQRLDSLTFDAFAKTLLERFRLALPPAQRPTADYILDLAMNDRSVEPVVGGIPESRGGLTARELASVSVRSVFSSEFIGRPLALDAGKPATLRERTAELLWKELLHGSPRSILGFQMIGRLAELLLRASPRVLGALRATYAYVFLDEFQDTTGVQYDLTRRAFRGSGAVVTAVGDNKQRIMGWAGALGGVFELFRDEFGATVHRLRRNYRAAPELVRIVGVITQAIDADAATPIPVNDVADGAGECRVLLFRNDDDEAAYLAEAVGQWTEDTLRPRDICILTRNRPADYTQRLRAALAARGIEGRVESELQDVLAEPVTSLLIAMMRLAVGGAFPESRTRLLEFLEESANDASVASARRIERTLWSFVEVIRERIARPEHGEAEVARLLQDMVEFLGQVRLAATHPQYRQGDLLAVTVGIVAKTLSAYLSVRDWPDAVDALEGATSVPIMTMHKSKGLEYHTVVFVGLEDDALWGFARAQEEETRGFFVALSRAKMRMIFTFCARRERPGRGAEAQTRRTIGRLYDLLQQAGIETEQL